MYFDPFEPIREETADDLLLAENESLRIRVAELEKTVSRQQSELMLLQTTSADLLRRLAKLEAMQNNGIANNGLKAAPKSRMPPKNVSQSTYNISKAASPSRNGLSRSLYAPSSRNDRIEESPRMNDSISSLKGFSNTMVNVSVGKSSRGSPLRKWMSHQNVKGSPSSTNPLSESTTSGRTTPSLVSGSHHHSSWTVPRSISRAGSACTLYSSPRIHCNAGCNSREPIFNSSSHVLQLQVAGRSVTVPVPTSVENFDPTVNQPAPDSPPPRLVWVYGYRGKDVRNNVHYLPTGELLYFCGSVVVLHNVEEHTQRHYTGHTCDIRSVCVHPNRVLVASGQSSRHQRERHPDLELRDPYVSAVDLEEDLEHSLTEAHVRIWDSVTLSTLKILSGSKAMFEKAVSCLAFSATDGGNLLACVDDSYQHTLSIWKWANEAKVAEAKGANDQVFCIGWHPSVKNLLVTCGRGHFSFWVLDLKRETLTRNSAIFEVVSHPTSYRGRDKPKTVLSMCFSDTGEVITGDSNGTLSLWDPTTYKTKKQRKVIVKAYAVHPGGVFALCISRKGTLLSAGKDRTIAEWETTDLVRRRRPVELPDDAGTPRVISNPDGNKILVGTSRNTLFSGDFETDFEEIVDFQQLITFLGDTDDVTYCVAVQPHLFVTTSADGGVRQYNSSTKRREWRKNFGDGILCASADPAGSLLALGFCTGTWSVMDLSTRDTVFEQKESTQPITAIQFAPNGALLFVATKELSALVYRFDTPQRFSRIARIGTLSSFAISPDWDVTSQYIRANSTVGHIYHWSATSGELVDHATVRDAEWETCNCRISFEAGCVAHSVEGDSLASSKD
ncbi:hypothetical protein Y032_0140g2199 [Ancylostoma ceylanicum]|uniref:Uncharacterized protein n=1 Tax=Ancylostoma ceylanicum TaxID=53326 RepID=A0A016T4L5_9BILA|nr:hypothetical protein Y032_0140g2199 [Ancylostoma ceylanicum]